MNMFICADEVGCFTGFHESLGMNRLQRSCETDYDSQSITVQQNVLMPSDKCPVYLTTITPPASIR